MKKFSAYLYGFLLVGLTSTVAGWFTRIGLGEWYGGLPRPFLTPPDSVFPVVWTILYIAMALSFGRYLNSEFPSADTGGKTLFIVQLLLQIAWCYAFFAKGLIGMAFFIIVILDYTVYKLIQNFTRVDKYAAWLLYPYFWWLAFATFLNFNYAYTYGLQIFF